MATATAISPDTLPEELREAIDAQWSGRFDNDHDAEGALPALVARIADPLVDSAVRTLESGGGSAWEPLREGTGPEAFWTDLRPSQAVRLMELVEEAQVRATARCTAVITEEVIAAGVKFAEEHPGALRTADRPPVERQRRGA